MRRPKLLLVTVAALSVIVPAVANAQCVIFDKPEDLFRRADVVFLGTVVATEPTDERGAHATVEIATLRVEQKWKGDLARELRVGSDRPFERQKRYVVFAGGKPLTTSILCRWTEREDHATTKLEWLAKGQQVLVQGDAVDVAVCEREAEKLLVKGCSPSRRTSSCPQENQERFPRLSSAAGRNSRPHGHPVDGRRIDRHKRQSLARVGPA